MWLWWRHHCPRWQAGVISDVIHTFHMIMTATKHIIRWDIDVCFSYWCLRLLIWPAGTSDKYNRQPCMIKDGLSIVAFIRFMAAWQGPGLGHDQQGHDGQAWACCVDPATGVCRSMITQSAHTQFYNDICTLILPLPNLFDFRHNQYSQDANIAGYRPHSQGCWLRCQLNGDLLVTLGLLGVWPQGLFDVPSIPNEHPVRSRMLTRTTGLQAMVKLKVYLPEIYM